MLVLKPAQLLRILHEQRPSYQGDLDWGVMGKAYHVGVDLLQV
jgi:hypothetical protein